MKEVRKKSVDAATNAMLVAAYRAKTDVIWDRTDAMQPQCGFGRLSICCTDCHEGRAGQTRLPSVHSRRYVTYSG